MSRPYAILIVIVFAVVTGLGLIAETSHAAVTQPVYICQTFDGCDNNQFLEVFDHNGSPIFSVGATGGPGTFGDNNSVFAPSSVFNPVNVQSYTDPATYNKTMGRANTCVAPEIWTEPHGIWTCNSSGNWVKRISL